MHTRFKRTLAVALLLALTAPLAAQSQEKRSRNGFNLFSREQEIKLGQEAAAEMEKELPVLPESHAVSRYVRQLGQRLAAQAPKPEYPYTFKVVNQKEINAFALPGGPVYLHLGILQSADNEAQVAGVLAHEIAHVTERHATENASKQMAASVPIQILGGMLGGGVGGQLARLGISFGAGSVFLKYGRDAERESDVVGARMMYDAGYDPQQMAAFFRKLEEGGGGRGPEFLSSHPNPGNRAQLVAQSVKNLPGKSYRQDSPEFRSIKQQVSGMKPLTAEQIAQQQKQQGGQLGQVKREEVMPSREFTRFEHSAYRIARPQNWEVFGDTESTVTIAPRAGIAENAIAYGVMIGGFQPESRQASLDTATHQLLQTLRQSNPELRVVGHDEDIRVNSVPAKSVDLTGPSPLTTNGKQERERDWLVAMKRPNGTLVYVLFIAPERDFHHLQPTFEEMLRTFRLK